MWLLGRGDVSLLRKIKGEFGCYDGFESRREDMKVSFKNCDMMPFMAKRDLWDLKFYDEKLYGCIVLSVVRIIVI